MCSELVQYFKLGRRGGFGFMGVSAGVTKSEAIFSVLRELILLREDSRGNSTGFRVPALRKEPNCSLDSREPPSCFSDSFCSSFAALASSSSLNTWFLLFLAFSSSSRRFLSLSSSFWSRMLSCDAAAAPKDLVVSLRLSGLALDLAGAALTGVSASLLLAAALSASAPPDFWLNLWRSACRSFSLCVCYLASCVLALAPSFPLSLGTIVFDFFGGDFFSSIFSITGLLWVDGCAGSAGGLVALGTWRSPRVCLVEGCTLFYYSFGLVLSGWTFCIASACETAPTSSSRGTSGSLVVILSFPISVGRKLILSGVIF